MWLPPKAAADAIEAKRELVAEIATSIYIHGELEDWSRELRELDPYLSLIRAKDQTDTPGMRPGFYHVLRIDPLGGPPTLLPLEDPETHEFREPGSWMFDWLRGMDMWNDRAVRDRKQLFKRMEEAKERRRKQELEEIETELLERAHAAWSTRVSFSDAPWSQNVAGRRGARG